MSAEAAWLERRRSSIGASEIGALWIALGLASDDEIQRAPKYMIENARTLVRVKAGRLRGRSAGKAAERGSRVERRILAEWLADPRCEIRAQIASACHADGVPRCWMPLVDRIEPRLSCTPDAWGTDVLGDDVVIEIKSTARECRQAPWYWRLQVQSQLAVTGSAWGALVIGEWWAADWREPGPITAYEVPRDEALIQRIRGAVSTAWLQIQEVQNG